MTPKEETVTIPPPTSAMVAPAAKVARGRTVGAHVVRGGGPVLGLALLLWWPLAAGDFGLHLGTIVAIYALAVIGVDLLTGRAGLLQLGYGVFFGTGAYSVGVLAKHTELPSGIGVLLGTVVAAALAAVIGRVAVGVSGYLFALVTLASSAALETWVRGTPSLGETGGLAGINRNLFGTGDLQGRPMFFAAVALTLVAVTLYSGVRRSRVGRALEALRLVPHVSEASGVDLRRLRYNAWVVSAAVGGFAGGLFAVAVQFVSPEVLGVQTSISFVIMNVVGGAGVAWSGIPGAALVRGLVQGVQSLGDYQLVIAGCATVAVVVWFPRGIGGSLQRWWRALTRLVAGGSDATQRRTAVEAPTLELPQVDAPTVELREVSMRFGGVQALDSVSFEIPGGSVTALVGPNGAGKSTLVNAVAGRYALTSGAVRIGDRDVSRVLRSRRMQEGITRTFQLVSLCETLSPLENVMLGGHTLGRAGLLRACFRADGVEEAMLRALALEVMASLGIDHLADVETADLSAGQRRLVEISRCLMTESLIVLLDEPASGLNAVESEHLKRVIRKLASSGRAVLLIEHDMRFVMEIAARIVVLREGRVIARGTPAEISGDSTVIAAYLGEDD